MMIEIGKRQKSPAGMVDTDEGGMRDQVQALLAAVFRMRPPANVGEQAGGPAEPRLLVGFVETERCEDLRAPGEELMDMAR
jgi:hypothetical protein